MALKTCPPAALMTLDVSTLTFAAGVVAFASGLILLVNWWLDRTVWAAFWWGAASCGMGVGVTMLALHDILPAFVSYVAAPLILSMCAALMWVAARIFNRGSVRATPVLAALGGWMAILIVMGATGHNQLAAVFGSGILSVLVCGGGNRILAGSRRVAAGTLANDFPPQCRAIALFWPPLDCPRPRFPRRPPRSAGPVSSTSLVSFIRRAAQYF